MLAGGNTVAGRALRGEVVDGPARDREFRMPGVVAVFDAVAVFVECPAVAVDQDGAERFVAFVERRPGKFDTAARRSRSMSLIATGRSLRRRRGFGPRVEHHRGNLLKVVIARYTDGSPRRPGENLSCCDYLKYICTAQDAWADA